MLDIWQKMRDEADAAAKADPVTALEIQAEAEANAIKENDYTDAEIAALETSNPTLFQRLKGFFKGAK